jgi:hypothetical protein
VAQGIEWVSLNPDTVVGTWLHLAETAHATRGSDYRLGQLRHGRPGRADAAHVESNRGRLVHEHYVSEGLRAVEHERPPWQVGCLVVAGVHSNDPGGAHHCSRMTGVEVERHGVRAHEPIR